MERDRQWLRLTPFVQKEVNRRIKPATRGFNRSAVIDRGLRGFLLLMRDARHAMKGRLLPLDLIQVDQALLAMGPNDIHSMIWMSPLGAVEIVLDGVLRTGLISNDGVDRLSVYLEQHKANGLLAILDLLETWRAEDKRFGDHAICERMISE